MVSKNLNSPIGRLHFRRPSVALYSGQFTHTSYNDSIEVHLQTEITVPELLFEADKSALFDLFVATSIHGKLHRRDGGTVSQCWV